MSDRAHAPALAPGAVYRTRELRMWGANAARVAQTFVERGELVRLAHGLYAAPKQTKFGDAPPSDAELVSKFLDDSPFVFTGSAQWNALGLGTTAVHAKPIVYNRKRSGPFKLGGREFLFRRVAFPDDPSPEWYVIDLIEHAEQAAASRADLHESLTGALRNQVFGRAALAEMARKYGSKKTLALVEKALAQASA